MKSTDTVLSVAEIQGIKIAPVGVVCETQTTGEGKVLALFCQLLIITGLILVVAGYCPENFWLQIPDAIWLCICDLRDAALNS